ncbi:PucR family transcriptional regulator [Kitasatospora sp. NPDC006697]|uniref:PucR family transcriptional regulator n=1 Tax=Kitasatospora sp. NPDC006697 TaxID=3364020 RepID=UPI0036A621CA
MSRFTPDPDPEADPARALPAPRRSPEPHGSAAGSAAGRGAPEGRPRSADPRVGEQRGAPAPAPRSGAAPDRLTGLVLRGAGPAELVAELGIALGARVAVLDADGRAVAGRPARWRTAAAAVERSRAEGRAVPDGDGWLCALSAGPERLGSLRLAGRVELGETDRRLFEQGAVAAAALLLVRRSAATARQRARGELLADLLTAAPSPEPDRRPAALLARARRLGLDLTRRHHLLVADAGPDSRRRLTRAAERHLADRAGAVTEHAGAVVLLLPLEAEPPPGQCAADRLAAVTARELGRLTDLAVTVGAGPPVDAPAELPAAHAEAVRCVRALRALGRSGRGGSVQSLGFVGVLLGAGPDPAGFVERTLGPLLGYDAARGTELVRTLRAYFGCGTSLTRAKEELGVHVNTVVQRLDRVAALLGPDWSAPERALELQLALRVHPLLNRPLSDA